MLQRRARGLRERMDDPHCDPERLRNTYAQFALINRMVSGWRRVFEELVRPRLAPGSTLVDIGCGGGDLSRAMLAWSRRLGAPLQVTGADPDPRALAFASRHTPPREIEFLGATAEELVAGGYSFDFVISNHLLHHLDEGALPNFLDATSNLGSQLVIHNDLRRHPAALLAFGLARPFFHRSYIIEDGLRSIRRSYTSTELRRLVPAEWRLESIAPFRNLLVLER